MPNPRRRHDLSSAALGFPNRILRRLLCGDDGNGGREPRESHEGQGPCSGLSQGAHREKLIREFKRRHSDCNSEGMEEAHDETSVRRRVEQATGAIETAWSLW